MRFAFALGASGWSLFFLSLITGQRSFIRAGVVGLAGLSVAAVIVTSKLQWISEVDPPPGQVIAALTIGSVGLLLAVAMTLMMYVFPFNLVPLGLCSAEPEGWICSLGP